MIFNSFDKSNVFLGSKMCYPPPPAPDSLPQDNTCKLWAIFLDQNYEYLKKI